MIRLNTKSGKKGFFGSFGKGLLVAGAIGFVFFAGLQVGSGQWSLSFSRQSVSSNKSLPNQLDYSSIDKVYDDLRARYDGELSEQKLLDGLRKGLAEAAGDPYTTYFDQEESAAFTEDLNGTFSGIGAELSKKGEAIVVVAPLAGSPAEAVGLRAQDIIAEIDGKESTGISVEEAVKQIRGEKGTQVKLTIIRGTEPKEFTITRDTIVIPSVEYSYLENDTIGYIQLSRFADDSVELINKATAEFKQKGVKGVILDLRNNPGGYLNGAVDISENWLKRGQVILEEKRDGKVVESFKATQDGVFMGLPTVVLINEGSASASEITAGALRDNDAATLVGVTSFGKGSVQEFSKYDWGGTLKVTIARWYTPDGKNIDKDGIDPDVKVELTEQNIANKQDPQKDKAIEIIKSKI